MSAHPHALFERAAPHAGVCLAATPHAEKLAEVRAASQARALKDAWKSMPQSWRTVLVMLACSQPGKPERIAEQPWESFSLEDQIEMAICARKGAEVYRFFGAVA